MVGFADFAYVTCGILVIKAQGEGRTNKNLKTEEKSMKPNEKASYVAVFPDTELKNGERYVRVRIITLQ